MRKYLFLLCFLILSQPCSRVYATEPKLADYQSPPIFTVNPVKPNILIILDNSGSMNFNAYGTWAGNGGLVTDTPYAGEPYKPALEKKVAASSDDAEENKTSSGTTWYTSGDVDLGRYSTTGGTESLEGIRFRNLDIPQGATITSAYIDFTALSTGDGDTMLLQISGEDIDDSPTFAATYNNIKTRTKTGHTINWNPGGVWTANTHYQTDDIKSIVQEIVDRSGWKKSNSMAFFFQNQSVNDGKRDAYSYDGNSSKAPLLHIEYTQASNQKYYGYFNPDWFYSYSSNKFSHAYKKIGYDTTTCPGKWEVKNTSGTTSCLDNTNIVSNGLWDGNWMNWATMRRIDIARKVIMGGLATSRTGGGNQTLYGETPAQSGRTFWRQFNSGTPSAVTPYSGSYYYGIDNGYLYIYDSSWNYQKRCTLAIKKNVTYEPDDFVNGNVAGVLQKVGDKAWWGNEFFYYGSGTNREGGYISNRIGSNINSLVTNLQNTGADTWTPLAESYYVATQYFKQEKPLSSLGYSKNAIGAINNTNDPYYQNSQFVPCAKSFVILLTDGASTQDLNIPTTLRDFDNDGHDPGSFGSNGSDYLDDVALYARTTDLRSDLAGDQNIILYPIYAFGNDDNARNLLRDAAKNGGFVDKNGNNLPDGDYSSPAANRIEWDKDGDDVPDTYFEAQDGYKLESKLLEAINDILRRAASGTAVSVLATSSKGEGNLVQAYFRPVVTSGVTETRWIGYLQSLWVDSMGFLREDTNANQKLDLDTDKVLNYFIDSSGNTKINEFAVSAAALYPDIANDTPVEVDMTDITPIWEAGSVLAERDPDGAEPRQIFTYIPGSTPDLFGGVNFNKSTTVQRDKIKPYLGVKDNTAWSYLGSTPANRADNLISYIRGNDTGFVGTTNMRKRTIKVNGFDRVWKLGDIVHSTPVSIELPPDNYGLIYADQSYQEFYSFHKNLASRETVVYVGANDGMLHAFTSWQYDQASKTFVNPDTASRPLEEIGTELWAYIPNALLPQLKWLPDQDYNHVYYVDLKPKIFDAKIFYNTLGDSTTGTIDTTYHKNGWGTILIGGLRMGGKPISVTDDFDNNSGTPDTSQTFKSSYFAIDISNPRSPKLLWEKSYGDVQFTTSDPSVMKVGDKWYTIFGSGPDSYNGTSAATGKVFVVDLATGIPYKNGTNDWLFQTSEPDAFMGGSATLDKGLNNNVDAAYIGETYDDSPQGWKGAMYKVSVPWVCTATDCSSISYGDLNNGNYITDPNDTSNPWQLSKLFASPAPITEPPALSIDFNDNVWAYFGTGRYLSEADKSSTDTEYLFGVKDPFFNSSLYTAADYYQNYTSSKTLTTSDLFDGDIYKVVFPWATYDAPQGDCSAVPTGQVGDIYNDGSCTCDYAWAEFACTEVTAGSCATAGITLGTQIETGVYEGTQLFNDGDCVCKAYDVPIWGCTETTTGACNSVPTGVVDNNTAYHSLYWKCSGSTDGSCSNVIFGTVGSGLGDGTCTCSEVTPPAYSCIERPAGDCAALATPPTFGDEGVIPATSGDGSCFAGYWTCDSADPTNNPTACDTVDYTLISGDAPGGFLGAAEDGDYFGDGTCICRFADNPIAKVINTTNNLGKSFNDIVLLAQGKDGWMRTLTDPGERSITKPSLLGGISLFTTYVPSADVCSFGGNSYLWALYFETGTAFSSSVFDPGTVVENGSIVIKGRINLGLGLASSVGIHVGMQEGNKATGFIQQSTGAIKDISLDPAFNIRSGLRYWRQK